ncbi:formin binding protein [Fusarium denticulatum]|uniref:Formin binding protein n=1 Tax=Fusarium denticulatum TaxID=48507 RepID=A0A8H5XEM3_9HYPO|nr:formin binding protein [Fusarium denticulatum]
MSEYWKSTPKYWCKHCEIYVRDTKLERQNHESTAKHQGALKRFLRDLHRNHEREEREKDRAKREVERLNGVVGASSAAAGPSSRPAPRTQQSAPTEASLKKQREQLAAMGVAMPSDFRPEMAMPGEWTVTNTRIIEAKTEEDEEAKVEARANGVRKREATEDEKEEENAVRGLFKKPRRWGRDSKAMPQQEDQELDALLSGSTFTPRAVKEETEDTTDVKKEEDATPYTAVKTEDATDVKTEDNTDVKTEAPAEPLIKPEPEEAEPGVQTVVFKKRKPKGIRQK